MAKEATRPVGDSIPPLRDHGVTDLVAAHKGGVAMQAAQITQAGAPPFSLVLADHGLADMADTEYAVLVNGETVAATHVDQSTIATTGFDVLGGADTEVLHVVIVGRLAGMSPDPADL